MAEDGTHCAGAQPADQNRRIARLLLISGCNVVLTGLAASVGPFVQLFAESGVASSLCPPDDSDTTDACDAQLMFLSQSFTVPGNIAGMLVVLTGWLFDRYGGHPLAVASALLSAVGLLTLQIPLLGAQMGYDAYTRNWLVVTLTVLEIGANLSLFSLMSMAWHLPHLQTFMAALTRNLPGMAVALVPVIVANLFHNMHVSLSTIMWGWLVLALLAGVCCHYSVPTMEEYQQEAEKALGKALPPQDTPLQLVQNSHRLLWQDFSLHMMALFAYVLMGTWSRIYGALLYDWGMLLFGSPEAGNQLVWTANSIGIMSCLVIPALIFAGSNMKQETSILLVTMLVLATSAAVCFPQPVWNAQLAAITSLAFYGGLSDAFAMKYFLAFIGPSRFGSCAGVAMLYQSLGDVALQTLVFAWMAELPSSDPVHISLPLQTCSIIALLVLLVWVVRLIRRGLPSEPIDLNESDSARPLAEQPGQDVLSHAKG